MSKRRDITGQRFGRLIAIKYAGRRKYPCGASLALWECICDCGNTTTVTLSALTTGNTRSCGCLESENLSYIKHHNKTHGESHTRLNHIWQRMKARCRNNNIREYKWYGALGVTVCDEWDSSYENFRDWALANGYDEGAKRGECTIDRIDPFGNYEPNNCRFVPMSVQLKNMRKHHAERDCG